MLVVDFCLLVRVADAQLGREVVVEGVVGPEVELGESGGFHIDFEWAGLVDEPEDKDDGADDDEGYGQGLEEVAEEGVGGAVLEGGGGVDGPAGGVGRRDCWAVVGFVEVGFLVLSHGLVLERDGNERKREVLIEKESCESKLMGTFW